MDADASHLQKFMDVPYVIEAPASKTRLASSAAKAMAGVQVRFDETRAVPKGRYREIVEQVRAQINGDLGAREDWRIDVFDRSAPDLAKEGARIDRTLSGFKREVARFPDGAFAQPFPLGAKDPKDAKGCIVVGFPANHDVGRMMSEAVMGTPVPMQGITSDKFQRVALWHELGHCLLGGSEVRADTFAALMSLRHGVYDKAALATLSSWREVTEWMNPDLSDDHYISASLWEVTARADALQANPRFMAMGIEEIANLARSMSDRFGLSPEGMQEAQDLRAALFAAGSQRSHVIRDAKGTHRGGIQEWLVAHSDIPEIARLGTVIENLVNGAKPMAPFAYDAKALKARLEALVHEGDPTAKAMLATLNKPYRGQRHEADFAAAIPYKYGTTEFASQVMGPSATPAPARKGTDAGVVSVSYGNSAIHIPVPSLAPPPAHEPEEAASGPRLR